MMLCAAGVGLPDPVFAQGCSDAGFCTIGSLKPEIPAQRDSDRGHQRVTLLSPLGQGDDAVFVWTPALQYEYFTSKGWSFQGKVTTNYADGNLGSELGAGDVYLVASRLNSLKNNWSIT